MEQRARDTVHGFVRLNYDGSFIIEITEIIYQYYLIKIASKILNEIEQISFMDLLYHRLRQQQNANLKYIHTELLFRASDIERKSWQSDPEYYEIFHKAVSEKGPTITIISNQYNHIFGGYLSKSKKTPSSFSDTKIDDPNAFLFVIRPSLKCFGFKKEYEEIGRYACTSYDDMGPIFGKGWDIHVQTYQHEDNIIKAGGQSGSFNYSPMELFGVKDANANRTRVVDFEVFAIKIE